MLEIRDVTVASDIFCSNFVYPAEQSDQIMDIEFFLEQWDEDGSAELLEDDNSCLLKPTGLLFLLNAFIGLF